MWYRATLPADTGPGICPHHLTAISECFLWYYSDRSTGCGCQTKPKGEKLEIFFGSREIIFRIILQIFHLGGKFLIRRTKAALLVADMASLNAIWRIFDFSNCQHKKKGFFKEVGIMLLQYLCQLLHKYPVNFVCLLYGSRVQSSNRKTRFPRLSSQERSADGCGWWMVAETGRGAHWLWPNWNVSCILALGNWQHLYQLQQEVCRAGLRPWALSVSGSLGSITLYWYS